MATEVRFTSLDVLLNEERGLPECACLWICNELCVMDCVLALLLASRVIVTPGNDHGILSACYIVKAIDRVSGEQIWSVDNNAPLETPEG